MDSALRVSDLDCKLNNSDIVGSRGFFSVADYCLRNPDYVFLTLSNIVEIAKGYFEFSKETGAHLATAFNTSAAGYGIVTAMADSVDLLSSAINCAEVASKGLLSDEFLGGFVDVVHDFGYLATDLYGSAVFLSSIKVIEVVNPIFRSISFGCFLASLLINLHGNICVLADGSEGKPGLSEVKQDLLKLNFKKNAFDLVRNVVSIAICVVALAGMVFCAQGTWLLGFVALSGSFGDYYFGREMQIAVTDAALSIGE